LNLREDGLFKSKHVQEYTLYNFVIESPWRWFI